MFNATLHLEAYLESKKYAWSASTILSEAARLRAVMSHIDGNPEGLWKALLSQKPYTRLTAWTRVVAFWEYLIEQGHASGPNPYKKFKNDNRRLFKHVYQKTPCPITYDEAKQRLSQLPEEEKAAALSLLGSGMRISELHDYDSGEQVVVGKGGRPRRVFFTEGTRYEATCSVSRLRRALRKVGLKPHDLRKAFLTRVVENGADPFSLCEIAGWASVTTASSYVKINSKTLERLVKGDKDAT